MTILPWWRSSRDSQAERLHEALRVLLRITAILEEAARDRRGVVHRCRAGALAAKLLPALSGAEDQSIVG